MTEEITKHWLKDDKTSMEWTPIRVSQFGITVKWTEKYGADKEVKCIGLWENNDSYRITYRDAKFIIIEKSNVNSIEATDGH